MAKTIYEKIMAKEITSVELESVLGRELYICNNGNWTDVLDEFSFSFTPEQFCQYIADSKAWAEHNSTWLEITEGKAEHRKAINEAKNLLKEFFENQYFNSFPELYKSLSAKEKEAVYLVASHTTINYEGYVPVTFSTTSELSLLWKKSVRQQKHKANLLISVIGDDYEYTINLFTDEVVSYVEYKHY